MGSEGGVHFFTRVVWANSWVRLIDKPNGWPFPDAVFHFCFHSRTRLSDAVLVKAQAG